MCLSLCEAERERKRHSEETNEGNIKSLQLHFHWKKWKSDFSETTQTWSHLLFCGQHSNDSEQTLNFPKSESGGGSLCPSAADNGAAGGHMKTEQAYCQKRQKSGVWTRSTLVLAAAQRGYRPHVLSDKQLPELEKQADSEGAELRGAQNIIIGPYYTQQIGK